MKFELGQLSNYVSENFCQLSTSTMGERPAIEKHETAIQRLSDGASDAIRQDLLGVNGRGKLKRFIINYGSALETLSGKIYACYRTTETADGLHRDTLLAFFRRADERISSLHRLLRENAPKGFEYCFQAPFSQMCHDGRRLADLVPKLEQLQSQLDEHNAPIITIVLLHLRPFLDHGVSIPYHQLSYYRQLLEALAAIEPIQGVDTNLQLHLQLITHNFNDPAYITHCNLKLLVKADTKPAEEKMLILLWYDTKLEMMTPHPGLKLYADKKSARTQLANWVKAQLVDLQRFLMPQVSNPLEAFKLKFNLGVSDVSLWFDMMMELGYVQSPSKIALWRTLAQVVETKGSDQPSVNSMTAMGNNPNKKKAAASRLIEMNFKMNALLRKWL